MNGLPPHDHDAEEAVLGSVLVDGAAIEEVAGFLQAEAFYGERSSTIYSAMMSLYSIDEPINQITLAQELDRLKKLEFAGGAAYLSHLISMVPTSLDIYHYAKIVHELSIKRRILSAGSQICVLAYNGQKTGEECLEIAQSSLDTLRAQVNLKVVRLSLNHLRIIKSSPPYYILNVNGQDVYFSTQEVQSWARFRSVVITELDVMPIKPKDFEMLMRRLLQGAEKIDAPVDASTDAAVRLGIMRWFIRAREAKEVSDLESGSFAIVDYVGPETENMPKTFMAFQHPPIIKWLKQDMGMATTPAELWSMMLKWGAIRRKWTIGNSKRAVHLWALPADFARGIAIRSDDLEPGETEQTEAPQAELGIGDLNADDIPI
jgi:hypothetical protein